MDLVITIDTEEDNWNRYSATDNPTTNIERIVSLQKLFDEYDVRPTYLITYPVATNPRAINVLKRILEEGKCEIGTHCHPWNTPPFDANALIRKQDTMLCNLPESVVLDKLTTLHETIYRNFGIAPVSFRAGRWGFGPVVARALCLLGYRVDSSVMPYTDWRPNFGPDYSEFGPASFRFDAEGIHCKMENGRLLEVPQTVGFLQRNFSLTYRIWRLLEIDISKRFHFRGVMDCLGLINKVTLSPELENTHTLIQLSQRMVKNKYSCLNYTFHSSSLLSGLSPFVRTLGDELIFHEKIKEFLVFVNKQGWSSKTLSQVYY
jgi:hypothetical protein